MKRLVFSLLTILSCTPAYADTSIFDFGDPEEWSYSVAYNIYTKHYSSDGFEDSNGKKIDYNETNQFTGVRVNFTDQFGAFAMKGKNSYYEDSYGLGIELSTPTKEWEVGTDLGVASGYEHVISGGILPVVNPFTRYNHYFSDTVSVSGKLGIVNFSAFDFFIEVGKKF